MELSSSSSIIIFDTHQGITPVFYDSVWTMNPGNFAVLVAPDSFSSPINKCCS